MVSRYFTNESSSVFDDIGSIADQSQFEYCSNDDNLVSEILPTQNISSELERAIYAWIPSDETKNLILTHISQTKIDNKKLCLCGIAIKEEFVDPVKNLVLKHLGEEIANKRNASTTNSVTQDNRGLRQLIMNGCYNAALNLTTQLVTVYGQGEGRVGQQSKHTLQSVRLWYVRIALLIKLRKFSLAEVESQPFGNFDSPDLYFEYYPELYEDKKGSLVPFSFRLLAAELDQYLGKNTMALDKLGKIQIVCDKIISNLKSGLAEDGSSPLEEDLRKVSLDLWRKRRIKTLLAITRCTIHQKDYRFAANLIETTMEESEDLSGLYSALGRLYLQLGDINSAQNAFKKHLELGNCCLQHSPVQGLIHAAYISIGQNNFKEAAHSLWQAYNLNPENCLIVNNLGTVMTFLGDIRGAIKTMETSVFNYPQKLLHEALVINLCTLYELESTNSLQKKLNILNLVSQYKGDGFNVSCLKLH